VNEKATMTKDIIAGIREYASAYDRFQRLQDTHRDHLPLGDQKTGVIGEFYAMLFARWTYPRCSVAFAAPTQAWDIEVSGEIDVRIQTKTVSDYSTTRIISPIFPGWDHLYLLSIDRAFLPTGFWVVTTSDIFAGHESLRSQKMRDPAKPTSGSPRIPFGTNRIAELLPRIAP
jgi:hypothetical protein